MTSPVNNSTAPSNITNRTTLEESVFSRTARDIDNPFLTLFGQNLEIISELTGSPEIPEAAVTQAPRMRHVSLHEETPSTLFIPEYRRDQDRLDRSRLESTAFGRKTSQTTPLLPLTNPHLTREPSDQVTSDFARRKTEYIIMVMCFAPTCKHYSEREPCTFFVFPKDPVELKKWLKLIRRKDREPSRYSRICSCHFIDGNRHNGPTLFDHNVGKSFPTEQKSKKRKKIVEAAAAGEAGPSGLQQPMDSDEDILQSVAETPTEREVEAEATEPFKQPSMALVNAEKYFLEQEVEKLKAEMESLTISFSFRHIENRDHLIAVHTGLPNKEIFLALFTLFENKNMTYFAGWQVVRVPKIDQLLLTLMKLKLNLLNDDLAVRFNISRETVSNIFKTWLYALHEILFKQLMEDVPSRNKNKMCMPASFSSFTNCRIIIDCTKMTSIHPKNMERQRATYSSYKHRNTLKALVGVAPNGVVTFASKLYPGSVSDKKITQHCGITEKLTAGDLVLADKGFLISDVLPEGVALNVPPFLTTPQFSQEQVLRTRTIAKARIHLERAIKRIKSYTILSLIPATLMPHASVVFQVCAALTNLQFPLIKEVEHMYDY